MVQWRGARLSERTGNEEVEGVCLSLHLPTGPERLTSPFPLTLMSSASLGILGIVVAMQWLLPKSALLLLIKQFGHLV